eukprot:TRINITY_DN13862_c0_g2_i2.p2 TRINITY_DN13862_c0_g2~~TRINITY_DN13862_c0_g2_i2.p2  ORF type:complete len:148 (+),score=50.20 TRINITY_DN13862_c0_g2_i2:140-583(+)
MIRRPPRSTQGVSSAASDVYKRQVVGTTSASFLNDIHFHRKLRDGKLDSPALARYLAGNPAEYIKHKLNLTGPALTVTNACSSGSDAIGVGMAWIEADVCDMVVAGGCDELHPVSQAGFFALGVLSCLLYTSPSPRDLSTSRMPSSA